MSTGPRHHRWTTYAISAKGHAPVEFYAPTLNWAFGLAHHHFGPTTVLTYHGMVADAAAA